MICTKLSSASRRWITAHEAEVLLSVYLGDRRGSNPCRCKTDPFREAGLFFWSWGDLFTLRLVPCRNGQGVTRLMLQLHRRSTVF